MPSKVSFVINIVYYFLIIILMFGMEQHANYFQIHVDIKFEMLINSQFLCRTGYLIEGGVDGM